jgi:hypothetical protein
MMSPKSDKNFSLTGKPESREHGYAAMLELGLREELRTPNGASRIGALNRLLRSALPHSDKFLFEFFCRNPSGAEMSFNVILNRKVLWYSYYAVAPPPTLMQPPPSTLGSSPKLNSRSRSDNGHRNRCGAAWQ